MSEKQIDRSGQRYQKGWRDIRAAFPPDLSEESERALRRQYEHQFAGTIMHSLDDLDRAWAGLKFQVWRALVEEWPAIVLGLMAVAVGIGIFSALVAS